MQVVIQKFSKEIRDLSFLVHVKREGDSWLLEGAEESLEIWLCLPPRLWAHRLSVHTEHHRLNVGMQIKNCPKLKSTTKAVWFTQPQPKRSLLVGVGTSSKVLDWQGYKTMWALSFASNVIWENIQVHDKYIDAINKTPSYISSLSSPMRKRHRDDMLATKSEVIHWTLKL